MLDRIAIAAPCSADWEKMPGSDRVRHCAQCDKNVYDLSAMTGREAEALIRKTEGRLCARFYRRADGTILTENCPAGLRAIGRNISRWAGAAMSAAMAFSAASVAQLPLIQIASAQEQENAHSILGVVQDSTGLTIVPNARVTLRRKNSERTYTTQSDSKGQFQIQSLARGSYLIRVESPGFSSYEQHLRISRDPELKLTARLSLGLMGEVVQVSKTKKP
jgi:hypothetical protein